MEDARLVLLYRYRQGEGDWRDIEQPTPITWSPCRYGGQRPYFVCPGVVNGVSCNRRTIKLYADGPYFLCRNCYGLAYQAQRENRRDGKNWTLAHRRWLTTLRFKHPAQQIVLQDYIHAVEDAKARRDALMAQIEALLRIGRSGRPCRISSCNPGKSATGA